MTRPTAVPFDQAPFILFWETTRACDLACLHCRACAVPKRDARELSTREGKRLLDEAAAMGTKLVVLTGGDPAKRPDIVELVRHGTYRGLRMALTPSATPLVTREWLERLRDAGVARVAISIDGASAATHDRFRGVVGSWARSHQILDHARSLGLSTQANTSVSARNVSELPLLATQLAERRIDLWGVFFVVPMGRAAGSETLPADEVERQLEWLALVAGRVPYDIKTTAAPQFRRVLLQRKTSRNDVVGLRDVGGDDAIGRVRRGINDGQGVAFVSHIGDIQPSGFLPMVAGNVRVEGLTATYQDSPVFRTLRDPDQLEGSCGRCEFRKVCGGSRARAYATGGNFMAEDPACPYEPATARAS
jgi:radical SAM protein